jgi:hypothetical protein
VVSALLLVVLVLALMPRVTPLVRLAELTVCTLGAVVSGAASVVKVQL